MKPRRLGRLAALGVALAAIAFAVPAVASANEVTKWNEITVNTVNMQTPITSAPNAGSIFIAMSQGAVYGAVNAVERHGRPYLVKRSYPHGSPEAAAATAAYRVLNSLFPAQHDALLLAYNESLAGIPDGTAKTTGIHVGTLAADAMLDQGHDGRMPITCTFGSGLPGEWTPLPDANGNPLCDPAAWVKDAVPFLVNSALQFRTAGNLALSSPEYADEFNEVKTIGSLNSNTRTPAQSHQAAFWQTNPGVNYNAMARRFVSQFSLDVSDSARLFAMLDLSAADALITTWSDKYARNFWRPITAIRRADIDGNPDTEADPTWKPMFDPALDPSIGGIGPALITPPYPDHPSGANAYASASMHAFASFFGTDVMTFYATSSRFPGEQRVFHRFSDVINEMIDARVYAGIHFRAPDVQSANLGRLVERYIHKHQFASAR
jgi:hypothetical protein